jgi:hypothetical protein
VNTDNSCLASSERREAPTGRASLVGTSENRKLPFRALPLGFRSRRRLQTIARKPRGFLFWLVVTAAVYLLCWALVFVLYLGKRSPVSVHLEATGFGSGAAITAGGGSTGSARWTLAGALVRGFTVAGIDARAFVRLPVPPRECKNVARGLGGSCRGRTVETISPLTASLSKFESLDAAGSHARRIVVTLPSGQSANGSVQQLAINTQGSRGPTACLSSTEAGTLTIGGGLQLPLGGLLDSTPCDDGLRLRVRSGRPGQGAGLVLPATKSLTLTAIAPTAELAGATKGTLTITEPRDLRPLSDGGDVDLRGAGTLRVGIRAGFAGRPTSVTIEPTHVTSARLDGEELVPTNLDRHRSIVITAFFGGLGLLWVLVQFAKFLQQQVGGER